MSSASVSLTVSFPTEEGQQASAHTFAAALTYTKKDDDIYELTGSDTFSFELKGQAKLLLLKLNSDATAPVSVAFALAGTEIELAPGGAVLVCNPTPGLGVEEVEVTHTDDATLTVVALS